MVSITVLFYGTIIVGAIASYLSFYSLNYALEEDKSILKSRFYAILIISLAFVIHTAGDFFSSYADWVEHGLESVAHVMIFFAFLIIISSSKNILRVAEAHGFA